MLSIGYLSSGAYIDEYLRAFNDLLAPLPSIIIFEWLEGILFFSPLVLCIFALPFMSLPN